MIQTFIEKKKMDWDLNPFCAEKILSVAAAKKKTILGRQIQLCTEQLKPRTQKKNQRCSQIIKALEEGKKLKRKQKICARVSFGLVDSQSFSPEMQYNINFHILSLHVVHP